jgi:hypothetical protein
MLNKRGLRLATNSAGIANINGDPKIKYRVTKIRVKNKTLTSSFLIIDSIKAI